MNKKLMSLMIPLLVLLSGCGTSPDQLTGPDTPGFWEGINKIFCELIIHAGRVAGNNIIWGLIIVTIILRVLMIPLFRSQIKSSAAMNKVQPEIKKIQAKYEGKTDQASKTKMAQETQAVYARHGVNPLAGCLPSLIQMPLLFVFYGAIQNLLVYNALPLFNAEDMSSSFLIWNDLGEAVIPIAVVAAITTYFSTVVSTLGSEQAAGSDMMKSMKIVMPLMILFFGFTMPGALSVYWTVGNIVTILQTLVLKREDIKRVNDKKKLEKMKK